MATSICQYTPYFCLENSPDREAWPNSVHRVAKSWTRWKQPCMHRHKTFFACGSSAPVRVEHEDGTAASVTGTLAVPSVQGRGLPQPQELWPYQSLFSSLCYLAIRSPLWLVFLCSSARSGRGPSGVLLCCLVHQAHRGAPLAGVLLCRSTHQALKGGPWVGSYSVALCISHLREHPEWVPTLYLGVSGH